MYNIIQLLLFLPLPKQQQQKRFACLVGMKEMPTQKKVNGKESNDILQQEMRYK